MSDFATIDVGEAIRKPWDAIVIGAGPAGTVAACSLARRGISTLLVERHAWPRQKVCGGCLNASALSALEAIGLRSAIQDCGTVQLERLSVHAGRRGASVPLNGGFAIERSAFDAALAGAAVSAGAHFLPATQATVERSRGESDRDDQLNLETIAPPATRRVQLASADQSGAATARVIIAADGLGHPSLKRLSQFQTRIARSARLGLSLSISRLSSRYREGVVYMAVAAGGYVGLVRTRCGHANLAAAIDARALRAAESPEAAVARILSTAGLDVPDLASGERWLGTLPLTRQANRLSAERIVLVGDAAGYVEPFTGEGIGWAIASAISAVRPVVENLERWEPHSIARWEAAERRRMARGQLVCRLVSGFLRRPRAVRFALAALSVAPGLATPLVRHVSRAKPNVQLHGS